MLLWHGVQVAAPWPLPTPLWHFHAWGWILSHSTHRGPPAAWGLRGCRCPKGAAAPRAPTADMPAAEGSCFGWDLGESEARCPGGGCPLQRNHQWEGAGVTHPWCHLPCTPQAGVVSPAGSQDGVRGPASRGEMLHCCSTHCRSSITVGCAGSVLPEGGAQQVGGLTTPKPAPAETTRVPLKKKNWGTSTYLGGRFLGPCLAGRPPAAKRSRVLPLWMGGTQPHPASHLSWVLGCSSGAPQGHGGAMPEQQQWGPHPLTPHPPCQPHYLRLLLVHCRVRAVILSLLAMPEGGWKESSMSRAP